MPSMFTLKKPVQLRVQSWMWTGASTKRKLWFSKKNERLPFLFGAGGGGGGEKGATAAYHTVDELLRPME